MGWCGCIRRSKKTGKKWLLSEVWDVSRSILQQTLGVHSVSLLARFLMQVASRKEGTTTNTKNTRKMRTAKKSLEIEWIGHDCGVTMYAHFLGCKYNLRWCVLSILKIREKYYLTKVYLPVSQLLMQSCFISVSDWLCKASCDYLIVSLVPGPDGSIQPQQCTTSEAHARRVPWVEKLELSKQVLMPGQGSCFVQLYSAQCISIWDRVVEICF